MTATDDALDAADGADAIYTDVWASMGQEDEADDRRSAFAGFTVDDDGDGGGRRPTRCSCTACPPTAARRSPPRCSTGPQSRVWPQAENRMHAARGVLSWLSSRR